jgi:hypothetical protein
MQAMLSEVAGAFNGVGTRCRRAARPRAAKNIFRISDAFAGAIRYDPRWERSLPFDRRAALSPRLWGWEILEVLKSAG